MGLGDDMRKAWDRVTGKPAQQPPSQQKPQVAAPAREPITLKPVQKGQPNPSDRGFPEHKATFQQKREAPTNPAPQKPIEREAAKSQPKLQPARTPGPGPSMAAPGVVHTNRTSTFQQQQARAPATPAKTPQPAARKTVNDFKARDDQAADRQQQADKTGAQQRPIDRLRRPGEAPMDRSFKEGAERVQKEQRLIDQFKSRDQGSKSLSR